MSPRDGGGTVDRFEKVNMQNRGYTRMRLNIFTRISDGKSVAPFTVARFYYSFQKGEPTRTIEDCRLIGESSKDGELSDPSNDNRVARRLHARWKQDADKRIDD